MFPTLTATALARTAAGLRALLSSGLESRKRENIDIARCCVTIKFPSFRPAGRSHCCLRQRSNRRIGSTIPSPEVHREKTAELDSHREADRIQQFALPHRFYQIARDFQSSAAFRVSQAARRWAAPESRNRPGW